MTIDQTLELIAEARRWQYLIDEGFYDLANKDLPNYKGDHLISFKPDKNVAKIIRTVVTALAKRAGVSIKAATDALCNCAIRDYFKAHEDEIKADPKGFLKRLRAKKRA